MNNRFSKKDSRVLVYGEEYNYRVYSANNLSQVEEIINTWGKPAMYMNNFATWEELEKARKCYEWLMSALPKAKQNVYVPSNDEQEWFYQKQLADECFVTNILETVRLWDNVLPDNPNVYLYSKEKCMGGI